MIPGLRILALSALLLTTLGETVAQGHFYYGRNKVQYTDFDWQVLRTTHFDIYHDAEAAELTAIGAAEAEAIYSELVQRFRMELPHRVPLLFYATNLHFRQTNIVSGFIPPGVGGFFEFLKGRVVIPADGDLSRFRRVIRHELVHVFTFTRLQQVSREHRRPQQSRPPLWFTEGLAEYWSGAPDHQHEMVMRDAVASNLLVRLEDLGRVGGYLIYKQGESVCRFISERYGEEKLLLLIENSWRDVDFRRVMEFVLREDFATIADRYDQWVRSQYYPVLASAAPGSLSSLRLTDRGFSGKPVGYITERGSPAVAFLGNRRGHTNIYSISFADADANGTVEPEILVRGERGPRFEAFHAFESRMDVSRDGRLAFVTQSGGSDVIHVYELHTRVLSATYRPDGMVAAYSPAWDPHGRRLVFTGIDRTGFADLYVYDLASGEVERLTQDPFDDRDPHWSPCGRWIVFSSDRGAHGLEGAYNLFALDLEWGNVRQLTFGDRRDLSPRWSPDGGALLFTSAVREENGAFGNQDAWVLQPGLEREEPSREKRLTAFTSAVRDAHWGPDGSLIFGSYERGRFSIAQLDLDSLIANPRDIASTPAPVDWSASTSWEHPRYSGGDHQQDRARPYRRSYSLDVAQSMFATNPVWGTSGGGAFAMSDILGDDRVLVTAFFTETPGRSFVDGLNVGITRVNLARRMNIGYGLFRLSGLRFDRTDPDAQASYPVFFEQTAGAFGAVSYPLSRFQRVEASSSLAWNRKELPTRNLDRAAVLFGATVSLTHDNALYGANGPVQGWKGQVTAGTTSDVVFGNVQYQTFSGDLRHYARLGRHTTLASWVLARTHQGKEARLWLLGGSWDLRGYPFLHVRGRNQLFTSHELRFSIAEAPSAHFPLLAPFGVANIRAALFIDAARAWNDHFHLREDQLLTGRTLGSAGAGLRVNLFGGLVLRYDVGWRFADGFGWDGRQPFRQFFFGYDF
jgi:hypothetical protein